jgi:hypothetical protein
MPAGPASVSLELAHKVDLGLTRQIGRIGRGRKPNHPMAHGTLLLRLVAAS